MAEQSISISWKDHHSQLAMLCKTSLENNYLVDCTISAEGQCLKAHRLILSVCSPFFHMLFNEEMQKYPFVVLLDASFETLKAVINFVYCGEVQIPQGNLKDFLALAESLQINGLNTFTGKDVSKDLCGSSTGNVSPCPTNDNESICEDEDPGANSQDNPSDLSQQHLHSLDAHTVVQTSSSFPFEGCSESCEKGESESVVPPLPGQSIFPDCAELAIKTEINVNSELLFCESLESRRDLLNDISSDELKPGNLQSEVEEQETAAIGQQDLNQYSSGGEVSYGDVEAATVQPAPHLHAALLRGQQQNSQLPDEKPPGPDAEQSQPLLPVILVPKSEHSVNDAEWGESMDVQDELKCETRETDEETELALGTQPVNQSSSTTGTSQLLHHPAKRREKRCDVCGKTFASNGSLRTHKRNHTGERPESCDVCGKTFVRSDHRAIHMRVHTGERPFCCDVCGKTYINSSHLISHMRVHTGERPFPCDVCGKSFPQSSNVTVHKRVHTGERPYSCDVCGKTYIISSHLISHMRVHTGERPFPCDVCGKSFPHSYDVTVHKRVHTGEQPYSCDVCGKAFAHSSALTVHKRIHTGERPYICELCSKSFYAKNHLVKHLRRIHPLSQRD